MSATFYDYDTAFIWGKYQEIVLKEPDNFGVKDDDMYTILDVMLAKYGADDRDFKASMDYFIVLANTYLSHLPYNVLLEHAKKLLTEPIYRGGSKRGESGRKKLPETMTILRKFANLSAAIGFMNKNGCDIENNAIKVVRYLREMINDENRKSSKGNA